MYITVNMDIINIYTKIINCLILYLAPPNINFWLCHCLCHITQWLRDEYHSPQNIEGTIEGSFIFGNCIKYTMLYTFYYIFLVELYFLGQDLNIVFFSFLESNIVKPHYT